MVDKSNKSAKSIDKPQIYHLSEMTLMKRFHNPREMVKCSFIFMTENGKRDQTENNHQWQGGRNSSKSTIINHFNVFE